MTSLATSSSLREWTKLMPTRCDRIDVPSSILEQSKTWGRVDCLTVLDPGRSNLHPSIVSIRSWDGMDPSTNIRLQSRLHARLDVGVSDLRKDCEIYPAVQESTQHPVGQTMSTDASQQPTRFFLKSCFRFVLELSFRSCLFHAMNDS